MEKIVIYGSGGLGREVAHLIHYINASDTEHKKWCLIGYLNDFPETYGTYLNDIPILGGIKWLRNCEDELNVVVAIGDTKGKKQVVEKLMNVSNIKFPNLIHPNVYISEYNQLGRGNIISEGSVFTVNINLGDFITVGVNSTIGHDTKVGDYCTILPNSSVSGNDILGQCVYVGTNSTIIEKKSVGDNTIIGAGAVVIHDLPANCTAVGIPAKPIKFHDEL